MTGRDEEYEGYSDTFSYLDVPTPMVGSLVRVDPMAGLAATLREIHGYCWDDGYVYPPIAKRQVEKGDGGASREVEKADLLYRLPPTHRITLSTAVDKMAEDPRRGAAGLTIHLLGLLYGSRCQFHDWFFDGRISIVGGHLDHWGVTPSQSAAIMDAAIARWGQLAFKQRVAMVNLLYLATRTTTYEMEWERFNAEYLVCDGIFALAGKMHLLNGSGRTTHGDRIPVLCDALGIACDEGLVKRMVALRNDLLHEGIWDGGMPGEARSQDSWRASTMLKALSKRALLRLCGVTGRYVTSEWWGLVTVPFDAGVSPT
jgi:hypothetical protein